ncbi:unnamed protein product [Leuciscus chuanchicus]
MAASGSTTSSPLITTCLRLAGGTVSDSFKECNQFSYMHTAPTGIRGGNLKRICQRYGDKLRYATLYDSSRRLALYSAYTFKKSDGQRRMDTPWMYEPQRSAAARRPRAGYLACSLAALRQLQQPTTKLSASLDSEEAAVESSDLQAEDSPEEAGRLRRLQHPCLLRYPAIISFHCINFKMPCISCKAPLSDRDRHVICALCLGPDFESSVWSSGRKGADLEAGAWRRLGRKHLSSLLAFGGDQSSPNWSTALVRRRRSSASTLERDRLDSCVEEAERCELCEELPISTLRARLALFDASAVSPSASTGPRKKKRRSQRPPEPAAAERSPEPLPRALLSPSPPPLPDAQRPASARTGPVESQLVDRFGEEAEKFRARREQLSVIAAWSASSSEATAVRRHAALALSSGGCELCEELPMSTLRARLALFDAPAVSPSASTGPRKKKRRSQRPPEPAAAERSTEPLPRALLSPSPPLLPDAQRPASARTAIASEDEADHAAITDSCSLLASDSEEWSGYHRSASSTQESSRSRSSVDAELLRLLTKAVDQLGLDWSPPKAPAPNRLDRCFLPSRRQAPASRSAPFLPELHTELSKSWNAPFSARLRSPVSSTLSQVDGAAEKGYTQIPPVEEAVATHLCPPSARWRSKSALPSKACRTTSALVGRAFAAAGQAASALHSMAVLQILQADLLRELDEKGPDRAALTDLHSVTDLSLRATKSAAQAIGRSMASLTITERHLWLMLADMSESERSVFLNAPLSPTGLFGPAVSGIVERFSEVQKASQAMNLFLPRRSSSSAGRSQNQPPARSSSQRSAQPPSSQRRQGGRPRSCSASRHRPPPPPGTPAQDSAET